MNENKAGWLTTSKSKPVMIDKLEAGLRKGEFKLASPTLLDELTVYTYGDSGETEAQQGYFDDLVVAAGIAWAVKGDVTRRWTEKELNEFYRNLAEDDEENGMNEIERLFGGGDLNDILGWF